MEILTPRESLPTYPEVRDFLAEEADGEEEDEDAVAVHDGRRNEHRGVRERGQKMGLTTGLPKKGWKYAMFVSHNIRDQRNW